MTKYPNATLKKTIAILPFNAMPALLAAFVPVDALALALVLAEALAPAPAPAPAPVLEVAVVFATV
jgi:hypothetical protein